MADSSSQNFDFSVPDTQNFQGSNFPNSQTRPMSYPQHPQVPMDYQMLQYFAQQIELNSPGGSNFGVQVPFNNPGGSNFGVQVPLNSPSGSNFGVQVPFNNYGGSNFGMQVPFNNPGGSNFGMPFNNSGGSNFGVQVPLNTPAGSGFPRRSSQIHTVDDDVSVKSTARDTKAQWSHDEDILLIQAWNTISTDSITGNQQKKKTFWERVAEYYNANRPKDAPERSHSQVKNHYYLMNTDINKWTGIYNNFSNNRESGQGDEDVMEAAKRAWRSYDPKNKDFKFVHVWKIIQTCDKWAPQQMPQNPYKKSKNSETDSPTSSETVHRERPMGQQRAKRQAKQKGKMTSPAKEDKWRGLQDAVARELIVKEEKLKLKHVKFISKDTSDMSEVELQIHNMMVADIKAKYGWP